jgi:ABC-type branched-subunit amino acid transport system substrate-binding protein
MWSFFAGDVSETMQLYAAMQQYPVLAMKPFAAGEAIVGESSTKMLANSSGGPVYAIAPVGDPGQATNGPGFIANYNLTFSASPTPYSASGYDCANILIQAIESVLAAGIKPPLYTNDQAAAKKFRQSIIDELHSSSFSYMGVTGTYSFNGNAGTTNPAVSIYRLGRDTTNEVVTSSNNWHLMEMETYGKNGWQLNYSSN